MTWRDSRAVGTPNAGSLVNGVRLPASGVGYYTYNPATQQPPGGPDRTWGTARLVREVVDLGRWWARTYPKQPPLGIGDLSRSPAGRSTVRSSGTSRTRTASTSTSVSYGATGPRRRSIRPRTTAR